MRKRYGIEYPISDTIEDQIKPRYDDSDLSVHGFLHIARTRRMAAVLARLHTDIINSIPSFVTPAPATPSEVTDITLGILNEQHQLTELGLDLCQAAALFHDYGRLDATSDGIDYYELDSAQACYDAMIKNDASEILAKRCAEAIANKDIDPRACKIAMVMHACDRRGMTRPEPSAISAAWCTSNGLSEYWEKEYTNCSLTFTTDTDGIQWHAVDKTPQTAFDHVIADADRFEIGRCDTLNPDMLDIISTIDSIKTQLFRSALYEQTSDIYQFETGCYNKLNAIILEYREILRKTGDDYQQRNGRRHKDIMQKHAHAQQALDFIFAEPGSCYIRSYFTNTPLQWQADLNSIPYPEEYSTYTDMMITRLNGDELFWNKSVRMDEYSNIDWMIREGNKETEFAACIYSGAIRGPGDTRTYKLRFGKRCDLRLFRPPTEMRSEIEVNTATFSKKASYSIEKATRFNRSGFNLFQTLPDKEPSVIAASVILPISNKQDYLPATHQTTHDAGTTDKSIDRSPLGTNYTSDEELIKHVNETGNDAVVSYSESLLRTKLHNAAWCIKLKGDPIDNDLPIRLVIQVWQHHLMQRQLFTQPDNPAHPIPIIFYNASRQSFMPYTIEHMHDDQAKWRALDLDNKIDIIKKYSSGLSPFRHIKERMTNLDLIISLTSLLNDDDLKSATAEQSEILISLLEQCLTCPANTITASYRHSAAYIINQLSTHLRPTTNHTSITLLETCSEYPVVLLTPPKPYLFELSCEPAFDIKQAVQDAANKTKLSTHTPTTTLATNEKLYQLICGHNTNQSWLNWSNDSLTRDLNKFSAFLPHQQQMFLGLSTSENQQTLHLYTLDYQKEKEKKAAMDTAKSLTYLQSPTALSELECNTIIGEMKKNPLYTHSLIKALKNLDDHHHHNRDILLTAILQSENLMQTLVKESMQLQFNQAYPSARDITDLQSLLSIFTGSGDIDISVFDQVLHERLTQLEHSSEHDTDDRDADLSLTLFYALPHTPEHFQRVLNAVKATGFDISKDFTLPYSETMLQLLYSANTNNFISLTNVGLSLFKPTITSETNILDDDEPKPCSLFDIIFTLPHYWHLQSQLIEDGHCDQLLYTASTAHIASLNSFLDICGTTAEHPEIHARLDALDSPLSRSPFLEPLENDTTRALRSGHYAGALQAMGNNPNALVRPHNKESLLMFAARTHDDRLFKLITNAPTLDSGAYLQTTVMGDTALSLACRYHHPYRHNTAIIDACIKAAPESLHMTNAFNLKPWQQAVLANQPQLIKLLVSETSVRTSELITFIKEKAIDHTLFTRHADEDFIRWFKQYNRRPPFNLKINSFEQERLREKLKTLPIDDETKDWYLDLFGMRTERGQARRSSMRPPI
ncbi:MAG: hypothetical protein P1U63_07390 [Coxiellaceae bacterium]|nr:hypothetical protein [Coxiellaceae bacterium]